MKIGKISQNILNRSVLKPISYRSDKLRSRPAMGHDCGMYEVEDETTLAVCVNPVAGYDKDLIARCFFRGCNDILCGGAKPKALLVEILLPPSCEEKGLKEMMQQLSMLAHQYKMDIVGGHTQVMDVVTEPVVSITCFGEKRDNKQSMATLKPGMELVMTGTVGAVGARMLLQRDRAGLVQRFGEDFLERVNRHGSEYSCGKAVETALATGSEEVVLHNGSESGIFAALWEMGEASKIGFSVDLKSIPIRQETVEICEYFDENPYIISSEGTLLIGTSCGEALVFALEQAGCPAVVIGKVEDNHDRVVINGEERRFLTPSGN